MTVDPASVSLARTCIVEKETDYTLSMQLTASEADLPVVP